MIMAMQSNVVRGARVARTIEHLKHYLEMYDEMTERERDQAARVAWMPPRDVVNMLLDPSLKQRDRVEIVIVAFSVSHPGHTPSWDEIARILGITKRVVYEYGKQLKDEGRAEIRDGKFCLHPSNYEHPVRRRFLHTTHLLP
jgi:hypothetical protein